MAWEHFATAKATHALADDYADRLKKVARFQGCDLELLRVMLHLERNEPQVRSRALMWLRCRRSCGPGPRVDGGAVPRSDDADPMRMLTHLAKLTDAVHNVPLVLLIDQLEDMANQSAGPAVSQGRRCNHWIHRHRPERRDRAGLP